MASSDWREKYASLIINRAVPVRSGNEVVITIVMEAREFAPYLSNAAYRAGAKFVHVLYWDSQIRRSRIRFAPDEFLDEEPGDIINGIREILIRGGNHILVFGGDPIAFSGLDDERTAREDVARWSAIVPMWQLVSDPRVMRTLVAYPTIEWAGRLYPELEPMLALCKLTDAIYSCCRLNAKNPSDAWDKHIASLNRRTSLLNEHRFELLRYHGGDTNLEIGLPENHRWANAGGAKKRGLPVLANLPTEEIFVAPHRERVNGTAVASRNLFLDGHDFGNIALSWKDGCLISAESDNNPTYLKKSLEIDDNASRLGEAALVPQGSPLARFDRPSWMNLLYDENSGSHLACGRAYPITIEGGLEMNEDELTSAGLNISKQHMDFIIGTDDMEVVGRDTNGREFIVMENGEFAGDFE